MRWCVDRPAAWGLAAFALYFTQAGFISHVSWNAVELIIAQHLIDHGAYVTSLDNPSAMSWRPLFPTLLVTFFRLWTDDPLLIYRWICGLAFASLTASLFAAARLMWGRLAAHLAALLTVACQGLTLGLIFHIHSYSHVGMILVLGPALLLSVHLLQQLETAPAKTWFYALSGFAWGLCYLSRSELLLFAGWAGVLLAWRHWRRRWSWKPLAGYALAFAVCFVPYNVHTSRESERHGLLIRKPIYGFYTGEGWLGIHADLGPDMEAGGYIRAIETYGDPIANRESLLVAIGNNPAAFLKRVQANTRNFYGHLRNPQFFSPLWTYAALAGLILAFVLRTQRASRPIILLLAGAFAATHFLLIFHIDSRYLSIALPPLLLLVVFAVQALARHWTLAITLAIVVALPGKDTVRRLIDHPAHDPLPVAVLRALGEHFRATGPHPRPATNLEPHLYVIFPDFSRMAPEDHMLLGYFSRTSLAASGAEGPFPRGRLYSFRDCPNNFLYMPYAMAKDGGRNIVGDLELPVLGRYALVTETP